MKKTGLNKSYATAVTVFLVNVCGTIGESIPSIYLPPSHQGIVIAAVFSIGYLIGGLIVITRIAGVPLGA